MSYTMMVASVYRLLWLMQRADATIHPSVALLGESSVTTDGTRMKHCVLIGGRKAEELPSLVDGSFFQ